MTALKRQFLLYNRQWFSNSLPSDTIVLWKRNLRCGSEPCAGLSEDDIIWLDASLRRFPSVWRLTLLHEMAHIATFAEAEEHGQRWNTLMRRLSRQGAFDKLW